MKVKYCWSQSVRWLASSPPHLEYIFLSLFFAMKFYLNGGEEHFTTLIDSTEVLITSWQIDGETVADFIFLSSKITAYGDCSHEIKRHLLPGRKVMTNLDSLLKSRDITLPTKVCLVKSVVFQWSCMDVRVGQWRRLSAKELMLLNCGIGEDSWESLGLQGDPTSPSWRRSVLGVHWKDWCWSWNSNTLATWCEELIHLKRPWCWEILRAGGEGDNKGWDDWMASPTRWTWVWVDSGS